MQVENLLLSTEGYIRLCDFGSATTSSHYPDHTWTALQRSTVEDEASFCVMNFVCLHISAIGSVFSMLTNLLKVLDCQIM